MNHCGHCGAFVPKGVRFCCPYCAQRAAAKRGALRKPTVMDLHLNRQLDIYVSGPDREFAQMIEAHLQAVFQATRVPVKYLTGGRFNR